MKKTVTIIAVSCFLFACGNTKQEPDAASASTSDSVTEQAVQADPAVAAPATTTDNSGALTAPAPVPAPVNPSATPNTSTSTATGMNPPHGEPGHRCEIAVGAPLNSAPTTAPAPAPASNPVISTSPAPASAPVLTPATTAPPTKTAPGMNPPHGEPGHDCAIAVGAPLKK